MGIPDPCGDHPDYVYLLALYIRHLMCGVNITNKSVLRGNTLAGYGTSINILFELRGFNAPIDMSDPTNDGGCLINNCKKEEAIASQRLPLTNEIFVELKQMATGSRSRDSERSVLFDATCIGRYTGFRVSEFAQTSPHKIDYHTYPSGKKVQKAFAANDFVFLDDKGNVIDSQSLSPSTADTAARVQCTWRIQKNRQNGQALTLPAEKKFPHTCPVRAALRLVLRARRCGQPDDKPVACFLNKAKKITYLTGSNIAALFRIAAKKVYPNMSKEQLKRFSAHSLRVWACVLLDEAGMSPEFIKSRLRWMGDSFRMYLRDTAVIQDKHRDVLQAASQQIIDLINNGIAEQLSHVDAGLTIVEPDDEMGDYDDDMD